MARPGYVPRAGLASRRNARCRRHPPGRDRGRDRLRRIGGVRRRSATRTPRRTQGGAAASACSTTWQLPSRGCAREASRSGSRSSTGTCTTATARSRSSTPIRPSATRRRTSPRTTRAPAPVARPGAGAAAGTKHNRPLPPGSGDEAFVAAWQDELLPAIEAFAPEAILVSAGYDAHAQRPAGRARGHRDGLRGRLLRWSAR